MTKRTKYDVEGAVKPILPNCRMGTLKGELVIKTGLKIQEDGLEGVMILESDKTASEIGRETAARLFCALNWMGQENSAVKGFIDQMSREHRTLQQSFGHLLVAAILHFAEMHEKGWYDLRNEQLCKLCAELKPTVEEAYLPFI